MTKDEVIKELQSAGTEQNRKVYARHGIKDSLGVSYANLYALQKKIKVDQALAEALWDTGVHDARVLATLIADPGQIKLATLERWIKNFGDHALSGAVAKVAAASPHAWKLAEKWTAQVKQEHVAVAGWDVLAALAMNDVSTDDERFEPYLARIESDIHGSLNYVRYAMNGALIAIGGRNDALEAKALAVAKKIGTVEVDHGETCCKTPDATSYIQKMTKRRKVKAKKPAARKKAKA